MPIANPVNECQRRFNELCERGGGQRGGPARTRVQQLLHESGQQLNELAHREITENLAHYSEASPWQVCFAVGLSWGHLAKPDIEFTGAAVRCLSNLNDDDLRLAASYHLERGPEPIVRSLQAGYTMFGQVRLPAALPSDLPQYGRAQERWLGHVLSPDRPRYIGSWNATAMFMVALFSDPALATTYLSPVFMLPPGGPIFNGLSILHRHHLLSTRPSGSDLDDATFEPGAIYENNALFAEILRGHAGWNLLDVHSGIYMLGTRHPHTDQWFA